MASPRTALLVIDMQRVFEPMTTTTALPNIKRLISHFQSSSSPSSSNSAPTSAPPPIIFTQHGHSEQELTTVPSPSQLVRKWGPEGSIARGSWGWELQDYFREEVVGAGGGRDGDDEKGKEKEKKWPRVVHKNTYDAFINTELGRILEEERVERTVVCGVMTDCCCDTTARSAFNRGYETWLISDACGTANEAQHRAGLRGFGFAFGDVLTTAEALKLLHL